MLRKYFFACLFTATFGLGWGTAYLGADEFRDLLVESKRRYENKEYERAVDLLKEIAKRGRPGSEERVEARTLLFVGGARAGKCDGDLGIDVLLESMHLESKNRALYDEVQFNVIDTLAISDTLARLDKSATLVAIKKEVIEKTSELENRMIDRGVSAGVAKLALFGRVKFAIECQDFSSAHGLLMQLQPVISSPLIASHWKALMWKQSADIHLEQRNFAAALHAGSQFAENARQYQKQYPNLEWNVVSDDLLAYLYLRMGDYANAKNLLERTQLVPLKNPSLERSTKWHIDMSKALEGERQFLKARDILLEGKRILDEQPASTPTLPIFVARVLNNLGVSYYMTGELEQSRTYFESTRRIFESQGISRSLFAAESMINQGWLELASQRPKEAVQQFHEASLLVADIASENHVRFAEALAGAARAYLAIGDRLNAATNIRRAEQLAYAKLVRDLADIVDPRDRIAILQETRVHPENMLWPGVFDTYLELATLLDIPVSEQWKVVLRWKGILNRMEMTSQRQAFFRNIDEVRLLEKHLSEIYFQPTAPAEREQRLQEIQSIEMQLRDLRRASGLPQASLDSIDNGESSTDWLHSLPDDLGVLSIVQIRTYRPPESNKTIGTSGEFIGFVAASGKLNRVSLGDANDLESAVVQWRKLLTEHHALERLAAKRVAKMLQSPLLPLVQGIQRLVIDADGICQTVPWGALPGLASDDYWIDHIATESLYDLSALESKTNERTKPSLLVVGDIDYGPLSKTWAKLPAAGREIQDIQDIFTETFPTANVDALRTNLADKFSVMGKISGKRVVHLATHGFYLKRGSIDSFGLTDATSLLDCGLIFAAPQATRPTGLTPASQYLTAADVMAMGLDDVELVVLSACETGLGKLKAGQGMDSLVASFHSAGVQKVVSSLWKIEDARTLELMRRFYANLWREKLSIANALRTAQRELMHDSGSHPDWKHPAVWGAFTISNRKIAF